MPLPANKSVPKNISPSFTGLSLSEARLRLEKFGRNDIRNVGQDTPFTIFLRQIRSNFVIYLLAAAALMSFLVDEVITGYTIAAVILIVVVVGFIQEYRSERAVQALKSLLLPMSVVRREGREMEIPSTEIVPGDILVLRTGERVPADAMVIDQKELRMNESVLTGESREVHKINTENFDHPAPDSQIFMGTFVVYGRCLARVTHTGMNTKFGQIARSISTAEKELPLQQKINHIGRTLVIIAVFVALATGAIMLFRAPVIDEQTLIGILIIMIAIGVSAFPEGFPLVLISTLSSGAHRMAKQNAIVNRMSIIETLGETTVVCADKTGTITRGEMTVLKIYAGGQEVAVSGVGYEASGTFTSQDSSIDPTQDPTTALLLQAAVVCNDATIERSNDENIYRVRGTATEGALLILGAKAKYFKDDIEATRVEEIPFSSERKVMSVLCDRPDGRFVFTKGAPEVVLEKCQSMQTASGIKPITASERKKLKDVCKNMTQSALRTLAVAYKPHNDASKDSFEEGLIFLGVVGMEDAPREEAKVAIQDCHEAGIRIKMITGDNLETAVAIGSQVGLVGPTLVGSQLDELTDDELMKSISDTVIIARVRPEHKLRIVRALKRLGEVVVMTGDGVNDAPALKEAQIGIAMGKNGTDVSRSVADLTLKDDNFATIVTAIKEGRMIFRNIRKFVSYQLSCSIAELIIIFIGTLVAPWLGWPVPLLLALQILFMNLVTDNLPALTLGFNPPSFDLMDIRPRKNTAVLTKHLFWLTIGTGMLLAFLVLAVFYISYNKLHYDSTTARTVALITLVCLEIASAYNFRSFRKGVLSRSLMVNKWLVYASIVSLSATLLIVYSSIGRHFGTAPIGGQGWLIAAGVSVLLWVLFDVMKIINNRKQLVELDQ